VVVLWVDSIGNKFGKILSIDRIYTIQQQTQNHWIQFVLSFVISICFVVCLFIFTLSVSERYETLKEVCIIIKYILNFFFLIFFKNIFLSTNKNAFWKIEVDGLVANVD